MSERTFDERFKEYREKYLSKDEWEYKREAEAWIDDCLYLQEHHARIKNSSNRFGVSIRPYLGSVIMDFFIKDAFFQLFPSRLSKQYDADRLKNLIMILDISVAMIAKIRKWEREDEDVKELLDFSEITEWYLGVRLDRHIPSFCGCSSMCEAIYKHIKKIKEAKCSTSKEPVKN